MRALTALIALVLAAAPAASAHGALTLNEFDTYAISDFEGQEDSFPWEGFEIWDIYAGDGYNQMLDSHGVYFKANLAGDGTLRPTGGESWDVDFTFSVGGVDYARTISHDGSDVTTDFEQFEWQLADGNVFQLHAWVPVDVWDGQTISNLVVTSSVDGNPRDVAPGGIFDPATGTEIPVNAPPTAVFPEIGEGRIVDEVPLSGSAKFLDVTVSPLGDGLFKFNVTNPLAAQGQHFMVNLPEHPGWSVAGMPNAVSIDGGKSTSFDVRFTPTGAGSNEPMRFDLMTDIGGMRPVYAYQAVSGVQLAEDETLALSGAADAAAVEESPGLPVVFAGLALLAVAVTMRRRA